MQECLYQISLQSIQRHPTDRPSLWNSIETAAVTFILSVGLAHELINILSKLLLLSLSIGGIVWAEADGPEKRCFALITRCALVNP